VGDHAQDLTYVYATIAHHIREGLSLLALVSEKLVGQSLAMARRLLSWLFSLPRGAYHSNGCRCRRAYAIFIQFLCLPIRSTARLILLIQASYARRDCDVPDCGLEVPLLVAFSVLLAAFGLGSYGGLPDWLFNVKRDDSAIDVPIEIVVERIIGAESNGDPDAKNRRSSATGLGQFLDETWLDLIRAYRPELAAGQSQDKTLQLRRDAKIAREMMRRFIRHNAEILRRKRLPVTPGTIYLAHFCGGAGAVAILSAPENADAASIMASADMTGRTTREKLIKANPFLERFTVADLRRWADRKMRIPGSS
jgi:hypothetical protein